MSPMAIYETVVGLARKRACPLPDAQAIVDDFLSETGAEIIAVTSEMGRVALEAFARFGKGRHKADLNMGDCFAYASARVRKVPLLFKGNDFVHTDIAGPQNP
jgi:ribonuclease VapC